MRWETSFLFAHSREELVEVLNATGAEPVQFVEDRDRVDGTIIRYGVWVRREIPEPPSVENHAGFKANSAQG